ncbi:MAG: inorganic diphosphatase [Rhodospirillaceae bacterium]|nr:inorganic diphosphatase [Rhodospirillaceae bacterium]
MTNLEAIPARGKGGSIHVVVETSRGMNAKCKYNAGLGAFTYGRPLRAGLSYPFDWGFIPGTAGADGDPLDAMVLHSAACPPGTVIRCKVMGVLNIAQTENRATQRNDRFILQPVTAVADDPYTLNRAMKAKLEQFFSDAVVLTEKKLKFLGWHGPAAALKAIATGERHWAALHAKASRGAARPR